MSNNAYLRCIGAGKNNHELHAENTLPEGWAWLFAPGDLYVGHPRENPIAAPLLGDRDHPTTSYLFCEAAIALPRFVERMRRAGADLNGKGMVASVHLWLAKYLSKGWWFADTSALEQGKPGEGIEEMRRMLAAAVVAKRFTDPSPETLLQVFGSGTGLSVDEVARKKEVQASRKWEKDQDARHKKAEVAAEIAVARQAPVDVSTLQGRPYSIRESFTVGEQIAHPVFKTGVVTAVTQTTVTVDFPLGTQLLAHQRK